MSLKKRSMPQQIFRMTPDIEIINRVLNCFNLKDINDNYTFSKPELLNYNTVDKLKELIPELTVLYIPCKANIYIANINIKNVITILRQFIGVIGFKLNTKEIIREKKKITYYNIYHENGITFKAERISRLITFD